MNWAGEFRTSVILKSEHEWGGKVTKFSAPRSLEEEADRIFKEFDLNGRLKGKTKEEQILILAKHFNDLNMLHPFREGNGRTQRLFLEKISAEEGIALSFQGVSKERMTSVSIASTQGNLEPIKRLFDELLTPERYNNLSYATEGLEKYRQEARQKGETDVFDWRERYISTTTPGQIYDGRFVGMRGNTFLIATNDGIFIGDTKELPNLAKDLKNGQKLIFAPKNIKEKEWEERPKDWSQEHEALEKKFFFEGNRLFLDDFS